jgi:hypothetical protein
VIPAVDLGLQPGGFGSTILASRLSVGPRCRQIAPERFDLRPQARQLRLVLRSLGPEVADAPVALVDLPLAVLNGRLQSGGLVERRGLQPCGLFKRRRLHP